MQPETRIKMYQISPVSLPHLKCIKYHQCLCHIWNASIITSVFATFYMCVFLTPTTPNALLRQGTRLIRSGSRPQTESTPDWVPAYAGGAFLYIWYVSSLLIITLNRSCTNLYVKSKGFRLNWKIRQSVFETVVVYFVDAVSYYLQCIIPTLTKLGAMGRIPSMMRGWPNWRTRADRNSSSFKVGLKRYRCSNSGRAP